MPNRPLSCPFFDRAPHRKNRTLMVDKWRPIVYGYCGQGPDCGACAGTGYKPNLEVRLGREFDFVPCPYCRADDYKKAVARLKENLPK
jgi:hypothetical protein